MIKRICEKYRENPLGDDLVLAIILPLRKSCFQTLRSRMLPIHYDVPRAYIFHDSEGRVLKFWKKIQQIHVALLV